MIIAVTGRAHCQRQVAFFIFFIFLGFAGGNACRGRSILLGLLHLYQGGLYLGFDCIGFFVHCRVFCVNVIGFVK